MFSLLLRNLLFTILFPGMVAGYFPIAMGAEQLKQHLNQPFGISEYIAIILSLLGLLILLSCILRFATEGKGTLAPVDSTKRLVVNGLYKLSRNPMYIGVMLILTGESLFALSPQLSIYSFFIFVFFNIF